MGTILLALDTSTKSTGCSIWINGILSDYILIDCNKNKTSLNNMNYTIVKLYEIIDKYKPTIIVAELTVVLRNAEVQRNLTMILGAILGKCLSLDIFWYTYRPTEWRKIVKRDGEVLPRKRDELKKWSIDYANEYFDIDINDDNISDAILIGLAYIKQFS